MRNKRLCVFGVTHRRGWLDGLGKLKGWTGAMGG